MYVVYHLKKKLNYDIIFIRIKYKIKYFLEIILLLAIDVGNTNISFGVYNKKKYVVTFRINTHPVRTADEYYALLSALFNSRNININLIDGVILCSVVPVTHEALIRLSKKHFKFDPIILSSKLNLGFNIKYNPSAAVGADRLANAIAAHNLYKENVIVVDFGTATSFDVIDKNGDYLGGAIVPGIQISLDALFQRASKLTEIELTAPKKAIGTDTEGALLSGVIYGYAGQIDAIILKISEELDEKPKVIATGGQAYIIAEHTKYIGETIDSLTLDGLNILYNRLKNDS